jgi:hypothetical protein
MSREGGAAPGGAGGAAGGEGGGLPGAAGAGFPVGGAGVACPAPVGFASCSPTGLPAATAGAGLAASAAGAGFAAWVACDGFAASVAGIGFGASGAAGAGTAGAGLTAAAGDCGAGDLAAFCAAAALCATPRFQTADARSKPIARIAGAGLTRPLRRTICLFYRWIPPLALGKTREKRPAPPAAEFSAAPIRPLSPSARAGRVRAMDGPSARHGERSCCSDTGLAGGILRPVPVLGPSVPGSQRTRAGLLSNTPAGASASRVPGDREQAIRPENPRFPGEQSGAPNFDVPHPRPEGRAAKAMLGWNFQPL